MVKKHKKPCGKSRNLRDTGAGSVGSGHDLVGYFGQFPYLEVIQNGDGRHPYRLCYGQHSVPLPSCSRLNNPLGFIGGIFHELGYNWRKPQPPTY